VHTLSHLPSLPFGFNLPIACHRVTPCADVCTVRLKKKKLSSTWEGGVLVRGRHVNRHEPNTGERRGTPRRPQWVLLVQGSDRRWGGCGWGAPGDDKTDDGHVSVSSARAHTHTHTLSLCQPHPLVPHILCASRVVFRSWCASSFFLVSRSLLGCRSCCRSLACALHSLVQPT